MKNFFIRLRNWLIKGGININVLTEILLRKAAASEYKTIEELPVADWMLQLSEGQEEAESDLKSSRELKEEYYESRK